MNLRLWISDVWTLDIKQALNKDKNMFTMKVKYQDYLYASKRYSSKMTLIKTLIISSLWNLRPLYLRLWSLISSRHWSQDMNFDQASSYNIRCHWFKRINFERKIMEIIQNQPSLPLCLKSLKYCSIWHFPHNLRSSTMNVVKVKKLYFHPLALLISPYI